MDNTQVVQAEVCHIHPETVQQIATQTVMKCESNSHYMPAHPFPINCS